MFPFLASKGIYRGLKQMENGAPLALLRLSFVAPTAFVARLEYILHLGFLRCHILWIAFSFWPQAKPKTAAPIPGTHEIRPLCSSNGTDFASEMFLTLSTWDEAKERIGCPGWVESSGTRCDYCSSSSCKWVVPRKRHSVAHSRPFDLLVFQFWSIFSHGPKR